MSEDSDVNPRFSQLLNAPPVQIPDPEETVEQQRIEAEKRAQAKRDALLRRMEEAEASAGAPPPIRKPRARRITPTATPAAASTPSAAQEQHARALRNRQQEALNEVLAQGVLMGVLGTSIVLLGGYGMYRMLGPSSAKVQ